MRALRPRPRPGPRRLLRPRGLRGGADREPEGTRGRLSLSLPLPPPARESSEAPLWRGPTQLVRRSPSSRQSGGLGEGEEPPDPAPRGSPRRPPALRHGAARPPSRCAAAGRATRPPSPPPPGGSRPRAPRRRARAAPQRLVSHSASRAAQGRSGARRGLSVSPAPAN